MPSATELALGCHLHVSVLLGFISHSVVQRFLGLMGGSLVVAF